MVDTRTVSATRFEKIEPLSFHHYHDRGESDLHTGRFRIHLAVVSIFYDWEAEIEPWLTDNLEGPFEIEDYQSPVERNGQGGIAIQCVLVTNELDAILTYLRYR